MSTLTRIEARARAALLRVEHQSVEWDLTTGAETFTSTTTLRFHCAEPGAATFIDLIADRLISVQLNGDDLDPVDVLDDDRISLRALREVNDLTVVATCAYSHTGEGLHRFVDPVDDAVYLYSQAALDDARRFVACFDQPDLKVRFSARVRAPTEWTVLANGVGHRDDDGWWSFAETEPISTYLLAVVAGPYHSVTLTHDDIELGIHCRQSLAEHFATEEILAYTAGAFDHYHRLFGVRYPFGKYDQIWVPEFNLGAMENAGCVTFRDELLFRSEVTAASHEMLSEIIAHEMAHQWFGNLVTMRWWDDLWLNESFADLMGYLVTAETTEHSAAWTTFCSRRKGWGYRADQLPSTHPVDADAPDVAAALLNFDGISYAKGASVLKQLMAYVGREEFFAGVRDYFARFAFGNTTLPDLLGALERSSGRDLTEWSQLWLRTTGVNTLTAHVEIDGDRYQSVHIGQSGVGPDPVLRPHRIALGLYRREGEALIRGDRVELDVHGPSTEVLGLVGKPIAALLLINDDDLSFAKIRSDSGSRHTLLRDIARIDESLPRALCYSAVHDMLRDGEIGAGAYLRAVLPGLEYESQVGVLEDIARQAVGAVELYGRESNREARLERLAAECLRLLRLVPINRRLALARTAIRAASTSEQTAEVAGWLVGENVPEGITVDAELRWSVVDRLAVCGIADDDAISSELARDDTATGRASAAAARASMPTAAAKEAAWSELIDDDTLSNRIVQRTAAAFWRPGQLEISRPYLARYVADIADVWRERSPMTAKDLTTLLFPLQVAEQSTVAALDVLLEGDDLAGGLRRVLEEGRSDLLRVIATREVDTPDV